MLGRWLFGIVIEDRGDERPRKLSFCVMLVWMD
jgi:hypothetical protein